MLPPRGTPGTTCVICERKRFGALSFVICVISPRSRRQVCHIRHHNPLLVVRKKPLLTHDERPARHACLSLWWNKAVGKTILERSVAKKHEAAQLDALAPHTERERTLAWKREGGVQCEFGDAALNEVLGVAGEEGAARIGPVDEHKVAVAASKGANCDDPACTDPSHLHAHDAHDHAAKEEHSHASHDHAHAKEEDCTDPGCTDPTHDHSHKQCINQIVAARRWRGVVVDYRSF